MIEKAFVAGFYSGLIYAIVFGAAFTALILGFESYLQADD